MLSDAGAGEGGDPGGGSPNGGRRRLSGSESQLEDVSVLVLAPLGILALGLQVAGCMPRRRRVSLVARLYFGDGLESASLVFSPDPASRPIPAPQPRRGAGGGAGAEVASTSAISPARGRNSEAQRGEQGRVGPRS